MTELLAFVAVVVAVAAPVCGHQTQPWPLRRPCAWLYARLSREPRLQVPRQVTTPERRSAAR